MRKLGLFGLTLSVGLMPVAGRAQGLSSDVFGGFSFLRSDHGLFNTDKSVNLLGWEAAYGLTLVPRFGVIADVSGDYGAVIAINDLGNIYRPNYQQYTFLLGPGVSIVKSRMLDVRVHALAGAAYGDTSTASFRRYFNDYGAGNTAFAASFGGSVDLNLTDHIAYRIIQPELLLTRFGSSIQRNLRASTGIVFRFGR